MKRKTTKAVESSPEAVPPAPKGRTYTAAQLKEKLAASGWRNATLDHTAPRAFELPASEASPKKPD